MGGVKKKWAGVASSSAPPSEGFSLAFVGYSSHCLPGRPLKMDTATFSEATWRLVLTFLTTEGLEPHTPSCYCSLG